MRRLIVAVLSLGLLFLAACGGGGSPVAVDGLQARKVDAGAITVTITPLRLDDTGAEFTVAFDTHTVDVNLDVASSATLEVDGVAWTNPRWTGAGPGGHHREGRLRFDPKGSPSGPVTLTITGLDAPAVASWNLAKGD